MVAIMPSRSICLLCGVRIPIIISYYELSQSEGQYLVPFGVGMFWLKLFEAADSSLSNFKLPWGNNMLDSPIGVICLAAIIVTSLINIYAHWIEDGLFGRLLYMASVVTAAGGLVHLFTGGIRHS